MFKKGLKAALLGACVMGIAASVSHAAPANQGSLYESLFGGSKGVTPPPKFDGSDPVTNPPGPRPPPRLDGSALEETLAPGQPGPRPPPK